ncbi:MAG: hypothetical protein IJ489_09530 [Clostridia bacterium]|nr:hypothetical protein [Clostridia bacterium]
MPQISKVRIVNFNYNDGKRLIADELYDFASKEKDDALNVLINLANGGGKSVLVQLMMQPIIPKAKVAGRKIESFFNKASDHCFVLLEWVKDNSTEKLLTGIAMSASEFSATEDDSSRGMAVKYYTFYSNYASYTSTYDIVNMPLSKKENGRFIAAEFDAVRTLARKSNGVLNYYVADDNPKWQKKLAEYGLIQSEWKMIQDLNSEEGGLSKYFGNFKTSDNLVDKLLIQTIERKLNQTHSKEDNSLSTMLLSYANQYASKQEVIREKEIYEAFSKELTVLLPQAESLWNANDALEKCIRELFGFSDSLSAKFDECKLLQEKYASDIEQLDKKSVKIEHERASLMFYKAKEAFDLALKKYDEATAEEQRLSIQRENTTHKKLVLECAEYYQKLLQIDGELTAIRGEISCRESGGENGQELARVKYSVYVQICELLSKCMPEAETLERQCESISFQKAECEKQFQTAQKALEKAKDEYTRADERLRSAEAETDREVSKYGIEISRRLDGAYASDELAEVQTAKSNEKNELEAALDKANKELVSIEDEISSIPQKKADLSLSRSEAGQKCKALREALDAYYAKEERIKEICSEYNLNFAMRFTNHMQEFLFSEQRANQARQAESLRKISIAEEEIQSAKRGSLHIPYAVIEYLNSTGVRYSTCEKYLTEQVAEGKLSNEECLDILLNYPAAAFGILMDSSEKERFFDYGREKWLPAMIPLYTYEQMAQILNNAKKFDGAIAFYSEEYFSNVDQFIENLESNQQTLINERDLIDAIDAKIKAQLEVVSSFTYDEHYEKEQKDSIERLEKSISEIDAKIQSLVVRGTELTAAKEKNKRRIQELSDSMQTVNHILEGIETVLQRISEEHSLAEALHNKKLGLGDAEQSYKNVQAQLNDITMSLDTIEEKLNELKKQISELNGVKDQIGECEEAELVDGDWPELYSKYQSLQSALNQELSTLKSQLEDKASRKKDCEREIASRELSLDKYKDVAFSEEQLQIVRKEEKTLKSALADATRHAMQAVEQKGKAEGGLESAKQSLMRFGEPLDKSEVGNDFDTRLNRTREERKTLFSKKDQCGKLENKINTILGRLIDRLKKHNRPEPIIKVQLEDSFGEQFESMTKEYESAKVQLSNIQAQVSEALNAMKSHFAGSTCGVSNAIVGMLELLSNEMRGDRYYTLIEHINGDIQNTDRAIAQIMTDLKEFENNHNDLIRQCVLQGSRIYEGLLQMASSSRVTVYDGKDKKQMIRFDIPAEVDPVVASAAITDEIDKGTKELVARMSDEAVTEVDIKKMAEKIVGSRNLLRKYIGKEAIRVDAYKIDQNPQNAGYRSWEQTQINNSGAEKFVVYFAVILSLMNYTRGDFGSIRDKDLRSALILDNPFGATSSKHILVPMFAIAKHFRVQMICLSDINKSDVINCFDIVIKAIVKKRPMSNNELLTHEGNESIEHGFYRLEQLSLL